MAKSFIDLQNDLSTWLEQDVDDLPVAIRKDVINISQRTFSVAFNTKYNQVEDNFSTVAGVPQYTEPTGFKNPERFWFTTVQGTIVDLQFQDKKDFDLDHPDASVQGTPINFTLWAGMLCLGPTPDAVYVINRNYYQILPDLVNDADTNRLTNEAWELILWGALASSEMFGVDDARIAIWERNYQRAIDIYVKEFHFSRAHAFKNQSNLSR